MKLKTMTALAGICSILVFSTGCGKEELDAAEYASAFLNYNIKGETTEYAKLAQQDEETLSTLYKQNFDTLTDLTSYGYEEKDVPEDLAQAYEDMWTKIIDHVDYHVTSSVKEENSYKVTVETSKILLYEPAVEYSNNQWSEYASDDSLKLPEPAPIMSLRFMTEYWNEALENITYQEPETLTMTLEKNKENIWTFSKQDMTTLFKALTDMPLAGEYLTTEETETPDSPSDGTPNMEVPDNLKELDDYKTGDEFVFSENGTDMVTFSIDSVTTSEERLEHASYTPEKVIVINYSYENTGSDDPVLFDDMSLQVLENEEICIPYYVNSLISTNIAEKGMGRVTGSFSYAVSKDCTEVTVVVSNPQFENQMKVNCVIE